MHILKYFFIGTKSIIIFPFYFIKYFFIGLISIISIFPYYIITGFKFLFSKKSSNKETQKIEKKIIPITILTLSRATQLLSVFILTRWFVQNQRSKNFTDTFTTPNIIEEESQENTANQYEDLEEITNIPSPPQINNNEPNLSNNSQQQPKPNIIDTNFINVNLNYHIQKNPETLAWIQVNGTKVNYPVVQHSDNDFYLEYDFNKRKTKNGWIFGDYRNDFENFNNNTIIYGHNLINGTMFGTIPKLLNKNWFSNKNNHYIKLSTKNTNTIWQIFSAYKIIPTTDYLYTRFNSTTIYQEFLNTLKNRSEYKFDLEVNYTDKIITLSTCDNTGTKRIAIHAKLIKIESK